jgi:hypothetical protein
MKICSKCKTPYERKFFSKRSKSKDGLSAACKKCQKEYRDSHKEHYNEYMKKYVSDNKDKVKEWKRKNRENHKKEILMYSKEYYREHKEDRKQYNKEYYKINKERLLNKKKDSYENNKEKFLKIARINRNLYAKITPYIEQSLTSIEEFKVEDGFLFVRCKNCNEWLQPTRTEIYHRIRCMNDISNGESNFYCSDTCKSLCVIYNQVKYDKFNKPRKHNNNKEWAKLVKEQDDYTCQICECKTTLQAHHIIPVAINPLLAEDLDNGICLCKDCHKNVHIDDCSYNNLKHLC